MKKLTLSEAQRTNQLDEFIRQQEAELAGKKGRKGKILAAIKRLARTPKSDD